MSYPNMEMMEEKKLRYFLILSHCLFLLAMPIFLLFPISSTQQLLHFCYKPISVIHIWKAFNLYFLHYFVDIALFPKIFITFRWLNGNKTFLTVFSGHCLISRKPIISPIFKTSGWGGSRGWLSPCPACGPAWPACWTGATRLVTMPASVPGEGRPWCRWRRRWGGRGRPNTWPGWGGATYSGGATSWSRGRGWSISA